MKILIDWALQRLSEASTWQGIVILLAATGVNIHPTMAAQIMTAGASVFGLINVIKKG
jgi:hypothetical protein